MTDAAGLSECVSLAAEVDSIHGDVDRARAILPTISSMESLSRAFTVLLTTVDG